MNRLFLCPRYTTGQLSSDDEGEQRTSRNVDSGPSTSNGRGKPTSSKSKPATSARVPSSEKSPVPQSKATTTPKPTTAPPQPPPTKMDIAIDINDDEDDAELLIIPDDDLSMMEEDIQEIQGIHMNDLDQLFPTITSVTSLAGNAEQFSELASPLENGGVL